ncbi:RNA polymerase sigma factor SigJ [Microlunatus sp. GCM10028923]|uniref:RNA polymerase sigma factor SigJ n=1 Tax=Microlunatus sp. GCM10028923 TaxID=3273400 RepID=UPI00360B9E8F
MAINTYDVDLFEQSRGKLEAIAYRLLGSATDAEDAVQDTFLRWHGAARDRIENAEAWLTKVLTNVCLNQLGSARVRRERYIGTWLPEPLLAGDRMLGPDETTEQRESVSIAMLTLMEQLSANERAVYVLREAFGYPHAEIAQILDLTEANCQQLYRRAKQRLTLDRTRRVINTATADKITEEFLAAAIGGDPEPLIKMLTDDAVSVSDGGGKVPARSTPIVGALKIARFLTGLFRPSASRQALVEDVFHGIPDLYPVISNGEPSVLAVAGDRVIGVVGLRVTEDGVAALYIQANPDKLARLTRQWPDLDHGEPLARFGG